jgi:hypothetical protein
METESAVTIDGITSIANGLLIYFKLAISNTHPNPAVTWCQKITLTQKIVYLITPPCRQKNWKNRVQDI